MKALALLGRHTALWLAVLAVARLSFAATYVPAARIASCAASLPLLLFNALRFDALVAAYAMLPLTALWLAHALTARWPDVKTLGAAARVWGTVVTAALTLLACIDMGFYRNFASHLNQTSLDFFNEGPWSLVVSIWNDYPVVWLACLVAAATAVAWWLGGRWTRHMALRQSRAALPQGVSPRPSLKRRVALAVAVAAAQFVVMRGNIGQNPLQAEDLVVTPDALVNDIVPNAPYMLKKAISERGKSTAPLSAGEALRTYGFESIYEAGRIFAEGQGLATPDDNPDTLQYIMQLLTREPVNPADATASPGPQGATTPAARPDIVLIVAESWSAYLGQMLADERIMMPEMHRHRHEDLWWTDFTSVHNGTEFSLSTLIASAPYKAFCLSRQATHTVPTALPDAFRRGGYATTFVTGMNAGWSNLNTVLPAQGFDRVVSKYELLDAHPEYTSCDVGVYDHCMLESLLEVLADSRQARDAAQTAQTAQAVQAVQSVQKPLFVMAVTTTNHPPLQLPDDVVLPDLPGNILAHPALTGDSDVLARYLRGYQYENLCLGRFMTALKASPMAANTIVAITGDHNVRSVINYEVAGYEWLFRVPLYVYLPPACKALATPDTATAACHYDLPATLAHFAGIAHPAPGRDLLAADTSAVQCAYNEAAPLPDPRAARFCAAREALLHILFSMAQ